MTEWSLVTDTRRTVEVRVHEDAAGVHLVALPLVLVKHLPQHGLGVLRGVALQSSVHNQSKVCHGG